MDSPTETATCVRCRREIAITDEEFSGWEPDIASGLEDPERLVCPSCLTDAEHAFVETEVADLMEIADEEARNAEWRRD